jgi:RHS repeat-associated protein
MNLLKRTAGNQSYLYMYNGHGDVTALLNSSGNVATQYYYDAFGGITEETVKVNNPFRYAGYEYEDESGLYYLKARHYAPSIARFMQEDTYRGSMRDPLSLNLYTYCHNEPVMYWDPTGHAQVSITLPNGTKTTGTIADGKTTMANGQSPPTGAIVHAANGKDYQMQSSGSGVEVPKGSTPAVIVSGGNSTAGLVVGGKTVETVPYVNTGAIVRPNEGAVVHNNTGTWVMQGGVGVRPGDISTNNSSNNANVVSAIQHQLNTLGFTGTNGKPLAIDGSFGPQTQSALSAFQSANMSAGSYSKGVAGQATLNILFSTGKATNDISSSNNKPPGGSQSGLQEGVFPVAGTEWHWESAYGNRYNTTTKESPMHYGIDIWAPQGTDLYAMYGGTVIAVNDTVNRTVGYYVHIESVVNGQTIIYEYLHMNDKAIVEKGDTVSPGDKVGEVGRTGSVRGENPYHLHVNVMINGEYVNPNPNFERPSTTVSKYNYESSEFSYIPLK